MSTMQSLFREAIFDPTRPVPDGLSDGNNSPAGRRFDVYRNNVTVSLIEALHTGFPVIARLLGKDNMDGVSRLFLRAHPPVSPLMTMYGDRFPDFLENVPQLAHIGYLADVARLEMALRRSYHAADSTQSNPDELAALTAEQLMKCTFSFAPSVGLVRSEWPIHDIWWINTNNSTTAPNPIAQDVLVTRPEFDPEPHPLPDGAATWIDALLNGCDINEALELTHKEIPDFDLTATLTLLLTGGALTSLATKD